MFCELLLLASPVLPATSGGAEGTVELGFKRYRDWSIELPAEVFRPVGDGFRFAGRSGAFAARMEGTILHVDLDGDGQTDVKVEGEEASLLFRSPDGFRYAARLRNDARGWQWSSGCARVGKIGEHRVSLIDQNADGRYDEVGVDAVILGRGEIAHFLGESVNVGGELYALDVAADGSSVELSSYEGETGTLDVAAGLETEGKLLSAIFRSDDGRHCFDVARARDGLKVPAGTYSIHSGKIGLGELAVSVGPGEAPDVEVAADGSARLEWGGPARAEFEYARQGDQIAIAPDQVSYFGRGGEEYVRWYPVGKSPVFTVRNRLTKQEVARMMFPGSC